MAPLVLLRSRDPDLAALRRAAGAAIVMPTMFAIGTEVLDNAELAPFPAFGSFAMLLLVDFGGPIPDPVRSPVALDAVGALFVVVGTLASRNALLAAASMAVVA